MSDFELRFANGQLNFRLKDHPLVHTWARMAEWYYGNDEYRREELAQNFVPRYYQEECDQLRRLGIDLDLKHHGFFDDAYRNTLAHPIYTRDDLNYLHSEYERIRTYDVPFELPEAFNDQIHVCERYHAVDGRIQNMIPRRPRIRTRFIHKEWGASAPWKLRYREEDRSLFEAPVSGRLYLCYCQVGKPPFSTFRDRDEAVAPVPWQEYGPAFFVTFQNWRGTERYDLATPWLERVHGPGVYWMGEPCLGELAGTTVEDAFAMVEKDPTIREMRWP